MPRQQKPSQGRDVFGEISEEAFAEVRERFPVGPDTPTRVNRDGEVVNMSREAMMARLEGFRSRLVGEIGTGE
jgi:hypothetical protein